MPPRDPNALARPTLHALSMSKPKDGPRTRHPALAILYDAYKVTGGSINAAYQLVREYYDGDLEEELPLEKVRKVCFSEGWQKQLLQEVMDGVEANDVLMDSMLKSARPLAIRTMIAIMNGEVDPRSAMAAGNMAKFVVMVTGTGNASRFGRLEDTRFDPALGDHGKDDDLSAEDIRQRNEEDYARMRENELRGA